MSSATILLIEDDESLREVMAFNLEEAGFTVDAVSRGLPGIARYEEAVHDVVITDIRMPDIDGLEVLSTLRARDPLCVVVIMTAYGGSDRALEAMRLGAFHYVEKPVNTATLLVTLDKAVELRRATTQARRLQALTPQDTRRRLDWAGSQEDGRGRDRQQQERLHGSDAIRNPIRGVATTLLLSRVYTASLNSFQKYVSRDARNPFSTTARGRESWRPPLRLDHTRPP